MAGKLPKNARLFTDSLQWLNDMLNLLSVNVISIPSEFRSAVIDVKKSLQDDCSGLVSSLLDFMMSCANVDYTIESDNETLIKIFGKWSETLNSAYQTDDVHNIPVGLKSLAKEYFRERWKGSSFLLLRTLWERQDGFYIPTKLAFVDGEDIIIPENGESLIAVGEEQYRLRLDEQHTKKLPATKNEVIYVQKPYESWSAGYPVPYIIRRGVYRNLKLMQLLQTKGERFVAKALEYLLLLKKGTEALALTKEPNFIYSADELKGVKDDFIKHVEDSKQLGGTPAYATNFDTILEHITPDYSKVINENIYSPIERKIIAGLGLIEVVRGIASDRREAILNPRPFVSEVKTGIEDFKLLVADILRTIVEKNRKQHRKYAEEKLVVHNTPVKEFLTDEIRGQLRSLYDRGCLSKRTYTEVVGDTDFDVEMDRRQQETKDKLEIKMYPPIVENREGVGIDLQEDTTGDPKLKNILPKRPRPKPNGPSASDKENIPTSKLGPEARNYNNAEENEEEDFENEEEGGFFEAFSPEVTENYIRLRQKDPDSFQKESFRIISLSKSKGIKAVIGRLKGKDTTTVQSYLFDKDRWTVKEAQAWVSEHRGSYEEGPYNTIQDLPPAVKKYPKGAQQVFRSAFNNALKHYHNETTAFKVAWSALKNWMKSHKGEEENNEEQT